MICDISGTQCLKFIGYVSESVKGLLHVLIVQPLEPVEETAECINPRVSLSRDSFIDFRKSCPYLLCSIQTTDTVELGLVEMTTNDASSFCIKLPVLLNNFKSSHQICFRNALINNIPQFLVNGFKMHPHLVLLVWIVCPVEDRAV